ncbi:MAG TPA: hypothetical protein DCL75_11090, partial [Ktedonobacter sp.]|nr:hypothetical protein [Ktedonobacter sp.]
TLDALFVLIIYALVCLASIRFFWRKGRSGTSRFRIVRHGIIPGLGTLLILGIFSLLLIAPAPPPLNLIPFILAAWVLLGVGMTFVLRRKMA